MPTRSSVISGRRLALLVATSEYVDPALRQLRAPGRDASELGVVLRDPHIGSFDVQTLINVPSGELQEKIEEFCADRRPDDQLLIYLSCHGVLDDNGRLYYAATNTRRQREAATAVAATWLSERLDDCRARRQIVVLDCCHSGAFARGVKGDSDLALQQRFQPHGRGRVVLTASRSTEYSFEGGQVSGEAVRSVFTNAIVEGLRTGDADRDKDGLITVTDLYQHVYDKVRLAEPRQSPELWLYAAEGDLLVAHSIRGAVVEPALLPEYLRVALESPSARVRETGIAELAELLDTAEPGLALAARQSLQQIVKEDLPRVADVARAALGASQGTAADQVGQERGRQEEQARREAQEKAKRQAEEQARREAESQTAPTHSAGQRQPGNDTQAPTGTDGMAAAGWKASSRALKNWRVRRGLLLLITAPALAVVALGGFRIASSIQSAAAYQRVETLAGLGSQIIALSQNLEDERDQTAYFIALGSKAGRAASLSPDSAVRATAKAQLGVVDGAQRVTDRSQAQVRALVSQIGSSYSPQTQQQAASVDSALAGLPDLRKAAVTTALPVLVVVQKYQQLISNVLQFNSQIAQGVGDPTLSQTVGSLGLVSAMKADASQQRAILTAALLEGGFGPGQLTALQGAESAQSTGLQSFDSSASVPDRLIWNNSVNAAGSFVYLASSEELQALSLQNSTNSLRGDPTTADDWYGAMSNPIDFQMGSVERKLASAVTSRAATLRRSAIISEVIVGLLLVVLALLFAAVLRPSMSRLLRGHRVSRIGARLRRLSGDDARDRS